MTEDPRKTGPKISLTYTWPRPVGSSSKRWWRTWRNPPPSGLLWPGSLSGLVCTVGGVTAARYWDLDLFQPIRSEIHAFEDSIPFLTDAQSKLCSSAILGFVLYLTSVVGRRCALRLLFRYRAWMYEPPGKQSRTTVAWGMLVKCLSGWKPRLFSCSSSMPRLPVPPLDYTIKQLMATLEPVYSNEPEKLAKLKAEAERFMVSAGPKLQRAIRLRSLWADNYVSDWWEKYVYLMSRSPLPINSNYYICDQVIWTPTKRQCARAACFMHHFIHIWEGVLSEKLDPLMIRGLVPVCMEQYRRVLSTTRVPGLEIDTLVHYSPKESQHVVVNRNGLLYRLEVTDSNGKLLSESVLEQQLEWIVQDADDRYKTVAEADRLVPVLTAVDRTQWAQVRDQYFSYGVNKETLDCVESALLYLYLDTKCFPDLSSRASHLLHGKAGFYWFDKSVQIISLSDGHIGLNCEHSHADAPVVAHFLEYNLTYDAMASTHMYDSEGHCKDSHPTTPAHLIRSKPTPLTWEVNICLAREINRAMHQANKAICDLDLVLCDHQHFGKGAIKKCKLSPDGFIQMALHVTFRRLTGKPTLTYEASMTRLYHKGRTETVRSLTQEADHFVRGFLDPNIPRSEVKERLRFACERHAHNYKDSMNGWGIDRHLFALYVASRGLGMDCSFLKEVLSIPWTLSTSQQPQQQIAWSPEGSDPKFKDLLSPGGGFGPVAADGYGVSYMMAGSNRVFFHVSSLRSAPRTDSALFMSTLTDTLAKMIQLHKQNSEIL